MVRGIKIMGRELSDSLERKNLRTECVYSNGRVKEGKGEMID